MKKILKICACALALSVALLSFAGCGGGDDAGSGGGAVKEGDMVNIDFVGMLDGVPFDRGSAEDVELGIGSGSFIPGFEEQIIGMNTGEVKNIDVTFPANYHEPSLAGQDVVFKITLNSIRNLTDYSGTFIIELYPEYAPLTVANFTGLVESGFYDGLTFHRIIDGFMAQGGCPYGLGTGGSGTNIDCETINNGWTQNTLKHTAGVISMAHSGPNTGSSQFFIMFGDAPHLDGVHAAFGRVTEGLDIVEKLQTVDRSWDGQSMSTPVFPVNIKSMALIADSSSGNPRVQAEISWRAE